MGDRVSISFVNKGWNDDEEESVILFHHWGGIEFAQLARDYANDLIIETNTNPQISTPLSRLEPNVVMVDFVRYLYETGYLIGHEFNKKNEYVRSSRASDSIYFGRTSSDGDNSDNGHHKIDLQGGKDMKLYKITDKDGKTMAGHDNETQWGENITHRAKSMGRNLCTDEVIHAYTDPYLAVFHNPIGSGYDEATMQMWEAKGRVVSFDGMKVGCKSLTTIRCVEFPAITLEQRVKIVTKCALYIYHDEGLAKRATSWVNCTDRSATARHAVVATLHTVAAAGDAEVIKIIHEVLEEV